LLIGGRDEISEEPEVPEVSEVYEVPEVPEGRDGGSELIFENKKRNNSAEGYEGRYEVNRGESRKNHIVMKDLTRLLGRRVGKVTFFEQRFRQT
jgi:hypothetical protein